MYEILIYFLIPILVIATVAMMYSFIDIIKSPISDYCDVELEDVSLENEFLAVDFGTTNNTLSSTNKAMRKSSSTYAPYTYLTKNPKGGYLLSIIVPIIKGKKVIFDPINYMTSKTKIVGRVVEDIANDHDHEMNLFWLKGSLLTPLNKTVEVVIYSDEITYKSYDKYIDADNVGLDSYEGVAKNCPHTFIEKSDDVFLPKTIIVMNEYEFTGEVETIPTFPKQDTCSVTIKLSKNDSITDQILQISPLEYSSSNRVYENRNFSISITLVNQRSIPFDVANDTDYNKNIVAQKISRKDASEISN